LEEVCAKCEDEHGANARIDEADADAKESATEIGSAEEVKNKPAGLAFQILESVETHLLELRLECEPVVRTITDPGERLQSFLLLAVHDKPARRFRQEGKSGNNNNWHREENVKGNLITESTINVMSRVCDELSTVSGSKVIETS
jgi:hypothetical protein